jgi:phosphate/phosphite/phosphonate ABC transporter binding protein
MQTKSLTFGYVPVEATDAAARNMNELMGIVGANASVDIVVSALPAYDRVAQLVHHGELDLAWVSPIPFIALLRNASVVPLASPQRGGTHYHGAIVVGADGAVGNLSALTGKRAAWVDRYSAAGFVVPRIALANAGLDVKSAFASQRFYGSHAAVVQAVADGNADFGATFVRLAENGAVTGGPWFNNPDLERRLRMFATFGEIPPDVIAAHAALDGAVRDRIRDALLALTKDVRGIELLAAVFGAEGLFVPNAASYEALREAAAAAVQEQLLDIEEELDPLPH